MTCEPCDRVTAYLLARAVETSTWTNLITALAMLGWWAKPEWVAAVPAIVLLANVVRIAAPDKLRKDPDA